MGTRDTFVELYGEQEARRVEQAAESHKNGVHDTPGSDHFRWCIAICLGHECFTKYREPHEFIAPYDTDTDVPSVKNWIKRYVILANHDGDVDFLALFSGVYQEFMPNTDTEEGARHADTP